MEENKEYIIDRKPRLLKAEEIECRVGTINSKGCSLLLFKDARVDMKILDETYGIGFWKRTHEVINDNLYCNIEIWNDKINQWVQKQDVGTESFAEKEKGEASDSFKRAGFNVGIGRELYTSPFIWIMPKKEMKPYATKDIDGEEANEFYAYKKDSYGKGVYTTKTTFRVTEIGYDEENRINKLIIKDNKDNIRFSTMTLEESKEEINNMPITEAQKQQIKDLYTPEEIKDLLKQNKRSKLSDLTFEEARNMIGE